MRSSISLACSQIFALKEFHRILKPEGWTVLIWNERDESDHFTRAYGDAFRKLTEIDKVEAKHGAWYANCLHLGVFPPAKANSLSLKTKHSDRESLILRAFSASYAPKETGNRKTV